MTIPKHCYAVAVLWEDLDTKRQYHQLLFVTATSLAAAEAAAMGRLSGSGQMVSMVAARPDVG